MKHIFYIILLFFPLFLFSQSKEKKKANEYFEKYDFDKAIELYQAIERLDVESRRNLAKSYLNRHRYAEAEKSYRQFISSSAATVEDYFNYALLLKTTNKQRQVKGFMEKIREKNPDDLRAKDFFENEENFRAWQANNKNFSIQSLKFNNANSDFGAVFYKDNKVVFTSTRKGNRPFLMREYTWNKKPFLSIFETDLDANKQFKKIRLWNKKENGKWHEGPISFSNNYTFAAFTRNNYSDTILDNTVRLEIFFTRLENEIWSEPEAFYLNNPAYSVGHPALSEDGKTLFFASDMSGGYGGSDIYYVEKNENGSWGKPINAGITINTEGNEEFPFYDSENGLLFFASNGLAGLGGLDIFVAAKSPCCLTFGKAENLGMPINSRYDDFSFIIDKNWQQGFFASNRPTGKGDDDIYRFTFNGKFKKYQPITPLKKEPIQPSQYRLFVLNEESKLPIENANVRLAALGELETDPAGLITISKELTSETTLKITVNAIGYKQSEKFIFIDNTKTDTVYLSVAANERIVLKNIYYDFDKSDILPESAEELDKVALFMKDNPDRKVELSSHTDSRGSDKYNLRLSEARAKSAVDYIISEGISPDKITAKGYGETQPRNRCTNGVPCSEIEHRENRRTEIFISDYGNAEHVQQTKGKF